MATGLGRLIPACAGSTVPSSHTRRRPSAHPRMRGEHLDHARYPRWSRGSSPHARGARPELLAQDPVDRLIPACAGSTLPDLGKRQEVSRFRFSLSESIISAILSRRGVGCGRLRMPGSSRYAGDSSRRADCSARAV